MVAPARRLARRLRRVWRRALTTARQPAGRALVPVEPVAGWLDYRCNVCGAANRARVDQLQREIPSCLVCDSTVRQRAIIHILSLGLFGASLALGDFPRRKDLRGMGLSDWPGYADQLAGPLDYVNTYLHQAPRLDITRLEPRQVGTLDFLIASEVFEHVPPPVDRAFANARRLLKPGGLLCFTSPWLPDSVADATREHFPELHDFRLVTRSDGRIELHNTTRQGVRQVFEDLVFHGGAGQTLEMRVFAERELLAALAGAGFTAITLYREPVWPWGIVWPAPWSLPITARA